MAGNSNFIKICKNIYLITTTTRYCSGSISIQPFPAEFVPIIPFSIRFWSDLYLSHGKKQPNLSWQRPDSPECDPTEIRQWPGLHRTVPWAASCSWWKLLDLLLSAPSSMCHTGRAAPFWISRAWPSIFYSGLPLVREKSGKFKVREKSGNFVIGQGSLEFWEKSGNFGIGQGNLTFSCLTRNNAAMLRIRKKCWCQNYSSSTRKLISSSSFSPPWYDPGCCWGVKPQ